jgi:hypothetical protein
MTPVSLKERMKQLQALKSSVQVKTQAALEKEKELENIASNSPEESAAPSELTTQALEDDKADGNKIQTQTDETNMSPALPVAPPTQEEEINNGPSKTDGEEANMPPALPVAPPIQEEEIKDGPSKTDGGEEFEGKELMFGDITVDRLRSASHSPIFSSGSRKTSCGRRRRWR